MTTVKQFYFDAPPGGLDSNKAAFGQYKNEKSPTSVADATKFTFRQVGSQWLVVEVDDSAAPMGSSSRNGLITAIENVYDVTHKRTVERDKEVG